MKGRRDVFDAAWGGEELPFGAVAKKLRDVLIWVVLVWEIHLYSLLCSYVWLLYELSSRKNDTKLGRLNSDL